MAISLCCKMSDRLVIGVGLPKSGTSSMAFFTKCNGLRTVHQVQRAAHRQRPPNGLIKCEERGKPLLCFLNNNSRIEAMFQLDMPISTKLIKLPLPLGGPAPPNISCTFPQVTHLHTLVSQAPAHTIFIHHVRNVSHWVDSVQHWKAMDLRMLACSRLLMPELWRGTLWEGRHVVVTDLTREQRRNMLVRLYEHHAMHVTSTFARLPGARLYTFDIEDPAIGPRLASTLQVANASCWGQYNARPIISK